MGRSIPSFALVLAILLGLVSRVGTVVVHAHADGDEVHHHGDLHYVGYVDHDHAHGPSDPEHHDPASPPHDDDSEHAHYVAGDGPIVRRSGPVAPAALSLEVLAFDAMGLALRAPSTIVPVVSEPLDAPTSQTLWPPGSTIERRLGGLGLLL